MKKLKPFHWLELFNFRTFAIVRNLNIHNFFEDKATKHFPADVKCFSHKQPAKSSWECSKQGKDCTCNNVAGIPGIDGPIGGRGGNAGRPGTMTVLKAELPSVSYQFIFRMAVYQMWRRGDLVESNLSSQTPL